LLKGSRLQQRRQVDNKITSQTLGSKPASGGAAVARSLSPLDSTKSVRKPPVQTGPTPAQRIAGWLAPLIALLILGCGGWFLAWYWRGTPAGQTIQLAPDPGNARRQNNNAPTWNMAPVPITYGNGPTPIGLPDGYVQSTMDPHDWNVRNGAFLMIVHYDGNPTTLSDMRFRVRREQAYHGDDLKLVTLAFRLMVNPQTQTQTGAPASLVQQLRDQFNDSLIMPFVQAAPTDAQATGVLWDQFTKANAATRNAVAEQLLASVAKTARNALPANQSSFATTVAGIRALIPADTEQKYLAAIAKAQN